MYKDVLQDGLNGNERYCESPSGMFTIGGENYLLKNILSEMCECKRVGPHPVYQVKLAPNNWFKLCS